MSETIKGLGNKFIKCKGTFGKAKVMISDGIRKDGLSKSKVDPCGVCNLRVKANVVLCVQCGKWIYGRCAG